MAENWKVGVGAGQAMFRLGLAEFRAAFNPYESPIVQPTDYGMPGMAIPSEAAAPRLVGQTVAEKDLVVDDRTTQAGTSRDDRGRDDRDLGQERE